MPARKQLCRFQIKWTIQVGPERRNVGNKRNPYQAHEIFRGLRPSIARNAVSSTVIHPCQFRFKDCISDASKTLLLFDELSEQKLFLRPLKSNLYKNHIAAQRKNTPTKHRSG
jgi:hypothetical protein